MKVLSSRKLRLMLSILCLCASSALTVLAQDKDWRPITPAELSAKAPVVEPDADAEAMFWEVRIDDSSVDEVSLRHYVRVKIFTERGREKYSKFDIPFTKGWKIKELSARVVKPDGSSTEVGKDDIFEREIVKAGGVKVKAKSFAVPNIEPGVIVEYRYRESIANAGAKGMRLVFQRDIPIQNLAYYYKPFNSKPPKYQSFNFTDTKFVKDEKGYWLANRKNVPSFREEPRMPPEDTVRPWILLTGASLEVTDVNAFSIQYTVKDPSNPVQYWGTVSAENAPLVKLMTKSSGDVKKLAADLTAGVTTPEDKLRKLYEYAQTQIKNTTYDTSLTDEDRRKLPRAESAGDVIKRKSASAQWIDMLFGAMASSLGYETRIAFSGDRSEFFFRPEMANENFVHPAAIAVSVAPDQWRYFNPGTPFLPYGMLIWYEEDTWALLVGEKRYSWERLPMAEHAKSEAKREGKFKLTEDGALEGTVRIEYNGQQAVSYRIENYDESATKREDNLKDEIKRHFSTAEISNIKIDNLMDASKPLVHEYTIRVPNYAQRTGKRLFLQPGFFEYGSEALFSGAARKYDIFFRYPWAESDKVVISLPAGFDLDSADAPGLIADQQKIGSLNVTIGVDKANNSLVYDRKFHFGGGGNILFDAAMYSALKNLWDAFQKSDAHTITLKQK